VVHILTAKVSQFIALMSLLLNLKMEGMWQAPVVT